MPVTTEQTDELQNGDGFPSDFALFRWRWGSLSWLGLHSCWFIRHGLSTGKKPFHKILVVFDDLRRHPTTLKVCHQRRPGGFDILGRFNDAPSGDSDMGHMDKGVGRGVGDYPRVHWRRFGLHLIFFLVLLSGFEEEGLEEMVPRPIRDFFVEDTCFFVFIEAKSEHATCSGEIVKERLVFRVLEDLGNGKCPYHTVGLHVNEAKPVFLLETHTMSASLRGRRTMVCVSVAPEDQNSFELRVAPV